MVELFNNRIIEDIAYVIIKDLDLKKEDYNEEWLDNDQEDAVDNEVAFRINEYIDEYIENNIDDFMMALKDKVENILERRIK